MAKRLEPILPDLIHHNQSAYVKGRSIFDAVRTIDDVLEYCSRFDMAGTLLTIDFEKAFDSINHKYLFKVLEAFNFGPLFVQWIRTFYSNVSSCVLNNGFATDHFNVGRGVRQGDPLSPLLFIMCLEVLACCIRQNNNIQGITVGDDEVKLVLFADDMSCFLTGRGSYEHLVKCIDYFSCVSGLRVNAEKTEFFSLGCQKRIGGFLHDFKTSLKILGIYFCYNETARKRQNFDEILKSIKRTLNLWRWRGLTLIGRIQIVKSFAIPKFMAKASLVHVSKDLIQEVNKELYNFIWRGKDKVKRVSLINEIEFGGLKMLDIESMLKTQRVMCLKKYIEDYPSSWKLFLDSYLHKIGGRFILQCQFDLSKLPLALPVFYKECLDAWSSLNKRDVITYQDIMNQVIWNHRNILSEGKSLYNSFLHKWGIVKVGDLVSKDRCFLKSDIVLGINVPSQLFALMGVTNAIPMKWRSMVRENVFSKPSILKENVFYLSVNGATIDLLDATSKLLYKEFSSRKGSPPSAQAKFRVEYPMLSRDWKDVYSLAFKVTLDTRLRAFQYKLLNRIIFTNVKLFAFKMVDSPMCNFCDVEEESLEHLLFTCKVTDLFWKEVLSWLIRNVKEGFELSLSDVLFGKFDIQNDFLVVNHILLEAKFFIYCCKLRKTIPLIDVFKVKLRATHDLEHFIAKENGNLLKHLAKWESFSFIFSEASLS